MFFEEDNELYDAFLTETREHIELIEQNLLKLESDFNNKSIINEIFRSYHTIKGSAAYMNYDKIKLLSHKIENLLDMIRKDKISINTKIIDFLFNSVDLIKGLLHNDQKELDFSAIEKTITEIVKEDKKKLSTPKENFKIIKIDSQIEEDEEDIISENENNKFLIFSIANVDFGISLMYIDEITKLLTGTFLPFTEDYITGLINVRGEIIPLIDLRLKFNLKQKNLPDSRIVIIKFNESLVGLKVDMVKKIIEIPEKEIKAFNKKLRDFNVEYIRGIYLYNRKPVIILDLQKVLERR